ncbi:hypothetical protein A3Q56_05427 [Intoshia linei]|uniref:Tubulin polyglutamylase TTLL6 n=1 Tax=Intoshia linei TaxID=1819745 RepID=A0A177AZR6_9BILA|nr:hypothetical protein A3Q56_05427 [Intoshia linei]
MGSQGKGIWITKNIKDINLTEHCICQQYISKPLLIDDFKFDLRLYALVTSCDPLRIFVFNDGLGRFATCKYSEPSNTNVENIFMHLTNYAINKQNSNFVRDDEEGSKRRITTIMKYLKNKGYDTDKIWQNIYDVIIKTLIAAQAVLKHNYRTCFPNHVRGSACFEILGFDILIDKKLKPYLLEVNHSPSFHTDAKLDKEIKESLLFDTLRLNNFALLDKKKCVEEDRKRIKDRLFQKHVKKQDKNEIDIEMQKWYNDLEKFENAYCGNFTRIYPKNNVEKYESFFLNNVSLYQETAATKARSECARQQREEIIKKQKQSDAVFNRSSNNSVLIKKKYARGESPYFLGQTSVKKKPRKSSQKSTSRSNSEQRKNYIVSNCNKMFDIKDTFNQPIDINKPMNIIESEELERINNMLQRDNLVRNMGIVEHVYKILHLRKTYYMRKIGEKKNLKINNKTESAPQNQIYANHFVNLTNSYGILNAQKKTSNVNLKLVSNDQNEYTAKVKKLSNMIYSDINIFLPKKQQGSNSNILKFKNTEKTKLITTNANQPNLNLVKNISKLTLPSIAKCSILHPSAHFPCSSKLQKCLSIVSAVADSTSYETMRESNSKNYEYINKI